MNKFFLKTSSIIVFVVLFMSLFAIPAIAAPRLAWDEVVAPTSIPPVIGYIIHYTRVGHQDNYVKNVGNVTTYPLETDLNLAYGVEYIFYVTVYNSDGESDPSNTVTWTRPINTIPADNVPDLVINVPPGATLNVTINNE